MFILVLTGKLFLKHLIIRMNNTTNIKAITAGRRAILVMILLQNPFDHLSAALEAEGG
jgi:hypothetical protein